MNRVISITIGAASLLLGVVGAPVAFAQSSSNAMTAAASATDGASKSAENDNDKSMRHRGHQGHRGMQELQNATPEERSVIGSIMRLERIYMTQGRVNDIKPLLDNVKRKTTNTTVTSFVDRQLARIANRPSNSDQQIATLTQKLNDDIAKLQ